MSFSFSSLVEIQSVIKSDKTTFIDFGAQWCGPCKQLKPFFYKESKKHKDCNFLTIDVDDNEDVADYYKITTVPSVLVFRKGKQIGQQAGYTNEKEFHSFVVRMIEKKV